MAINLIIKSYAFVIKHYIILQICQLAYKTFKLFEQFWRMCGYPIEYLTPMCVYKINCAMCSGGSVMFSYDTWHKKTASSCLSFENDIINISRKHFFGLIDDNSSLVQVNKTHSYCKVLFGFAFSYGKPFIRCFGKANTW